MSVIFLGMVFDLTTENEKSMLYTSYDLTLLIEICNFQKYGKLDVVVSNAAVNPSVDAILETKSSVLDKLWDINVKAAILLLQVS